MLWPASRSRSSIFAVSASANVELNGTLNSIARSFRLAGIETVVDERNTDLI